MAINNETRDVLQKAASSSIEKLITIRYATIEVYLAHANNEIAEIDEFSGHLWSAAGITRETFSEAIEICEASPTSAPPKLDTLPLSTKNYLQDKFNIWDNRMIVKGYESQKAYNCTKEHLAQTEGEVQSNFSISDTFKFYCRREVIVL